MKTSVGKDRAQLTRLRPLLSKIGGDPLDQTAIKNVPTGFQLYFDSIFDVRPGDPLRVFESALGQGHRFGAWLSFSLVAHSYNSNTR